ncbi:MAG TPA: hypothetical protein VGF34_12530 [Stellaceae bacterium]|jgi:hypothetical protein
MRKSFLWIWLVGLFGLAAAAHAQTPAPASNGTRYDGTYAFVSSTKLNTTYRTRGGLMGTCGDRTTGPLTVSQGQAQYTTETGVHLTGTVGPQGGLALRALQTPGSNGYQPLDIIVSGNIDASGTVRARQTANSCSYEFVWRKER